MARISYIVHRPDPNAATSAKNPGVVDGTKSVKIRSVIVNRLPNAAAFDPATGDPLLRLIIGASNPDARVPYEGFGWDAEIADDGKVRAEDTGIFYYWNTADGKPLTSDEVEIVCVPVGV